MSDRQNDRRPQWYRDLLELAEEIDHIWEGWGAAEPDPYLEKIAEHLRRYSDDALKASSR